jgi:elongation factor G
MAFKLAASQALNQGLLEAQPILLEPVMRLTIRVPSEYVGDVMNDMSRRRGQGHGVDAQGDVSVVTADVPLAEVQRYTTELRAVTQGRGTFTMEFERYVEMPMNVQEQVVKSLAAVEA